MKKPVTYREAGVDIDAGALMVEKIRGHVKSTLRPECLGDLGGFGGAFLLNCGKYREPVLVSGTDGVGTKLRLAFLTGVHDTIGIDAVAMCVNDILVQGAEPLFFLDYLAVGKLDPDRAEAIVRGIAEGCRQAGCALIGGETAEMPGFYPPDEYDVAGFAVGVVERSRIIDGSRIRPGDVVLGLGSSGLHSNGFSLARKVLLEVWGPGDTPPGLSRPLGEEMLTPTRIYVKSILPLLSRVDVRGMAHITGGGLTDNVPRVLPEGTSVEIHRKAWPEPAIFRLIRETGNVEEAEMFRTFNMGIGMVLIVPEEEAGMAEELLTEAGEQVYRLGRVVPGSREVLYR